MSTMGTAETYNLHQSLGYQLTLTARMQERRFEEQLKPLGLTRITWCVLLAVQGQGLKNPSDIATYVGIDRTATSRALRQMEGAGMLRRGAGQTDGRTTMVTLTAKGQKLLARANPLARKNAQQYQEKLAGDELNQLQHLLAKLRKGEDAGLKRL